MNRELTPQRLTTERLTLRPLRLDDAAAIERHCGNPKVARMTAAIPHPYPQGLATDWISGFRTDDAQEADRHFAILHESKLVGVVSLERRREGPFEVGYWLGEAWWGRGFATEAVRRLVAFAFDELGQAELTSGHFQDNPASGRVLQKCGFRYSGVRPEWSTARGGAVTCRRMRLRRGDAEGEAAQEEAMTR